MTKEQQIEEVTCGLSRMIYSRYLVDRYGIREGRVQYDPFRVKRLQLQKDLLDFGIPCEKLKVLKVKPLPVITVEDIACGVDCPDIAREFEQTVPALVWLVQHNLGYNPSVTIVDAEGYTIDAVPQYIDNMSLRVYFSIPTSGKVYMS